jgi:hypothetical protein
VIAVVADLDAVIAGAKLDAAGQGADLAEKLFVDPNGRIGDRSPHQ